MSLEDKVESPTNSFARERSHSAPAVISPTQFRRLSDLFFNFVLRSRSSSLNNDGGSSVNGGNSTIIQQQQQRRRSGSINSLGSLYRSTSRSGTPEFKSSSTPKGGIHLVHAVDIAVYESLERLNNGSFLIENKEEEEELPLPPPPPFKRDDELTEPTCLICLGKFTSKRPSIQIPCSTRCNLAPVHGRCIYEWKEQRGGSSANPTTGSCPLCRAPLNSLDYIPRDPLATKSLFMYSVRRSFVSRPAPKAAGMVRAYIRVVGTGAISSTPIRYEMFLQAPTTRQYPNVPLPPTFGTAEGDQFLMSAQRRTKLTNGCSVIDVHLDRDEQIKRTRRRRSNTNDPKFLASVRGSLMGLDYTINVPCDFGIHNQTKQKTLELGSIRFEQNRVGSGAGPRRISVCLPAVREDEEAMNFRNSMSEDVKKKENDVRIVEESYEEGEEEEEEEDDDDDDEKCEQVYQTILHTPASKKDSLRRVIRRIRPQANNMAANNMTMTPTIANNQSSNQTIPYVDGFIFARNRKPCYLEAISAFSLDFFGRVTLPSNKNFLLTFEDSNSNSATADSNILLFGKIAVKGRNGDAAVYTLDFQWPLSPLQAFCIALASCDRKVGCA